MREQASRQFELSLPERSTAEILADQLSAAVEVANAAVGEERRSAFLEVQRLRALLGIS